MYQTKRLEFRKGVITVRDARSSSSACAPLTFRCALFPCALCSIHMRAFSKGVTRAAGGVTTVSLLLRNGPGVVSGLCDDVYDRGLNIASSEMARVGDHFFIRMDVLDPTSVRNGADVNVSATKEMRETLLSDGVVEGIACIDEKERMPDSWRVSAALELADTPGVLATTTRALAAVGADLIKLRSALDTGARGTPLFSMGATWDVPNSVTADQISEIFADIEESTGALPTVDWEE